MNLNHFEKHRTREEAAWLGLLAGPPGWASSHAAVALHHREAGHFRFSYIFFLITKVKHN